MSCGRIAWTWAAAFSLGLLLAPGYLIFETPPAEALEGFVRSGRLGLEARPARATLYMRGTDGRFYPIHDLGTLLLGVPVALAARVACAASGVPFERALALLLSGTGAGLFATTVAGLFAAAGRTGPLDEPRARRLLLVLLSTQYLVYAGHAADVSASAAVLALVLVGWRSGLKRPGTTLATGFGLGVLVLLKATNLPILLVTLGVALAESGGPRHEGRRRAAYLLAGAALPLALVEWWNLRRAGTLLAVPYPVQSMRWSLAQSPEGLAGTIASPGKGLLWYSPALAFLLPAARRLLVDRDRRTELLLVGGSMLAAMAWLVGLPAWSSRSGWGIRYYVPWLPPLALLLCEGEFWHPAAGRAHAWARRLAVAAGIAINLAGAVTNFHYRQGLCGLEPWTLSGTNACAVAALPLNLARTVGLDFADVVLAGASAANVFASNRLAVWWYAARTQGLPAAASWVLGATFVAMTARCWRRASAR